MTEKITFKSLVGAACVGLVIGALSWPLTVWGQAQPPASQAPVPNLPKPSVPPVPSAQVPPGSKIDHTLPGSRTGTLSMINYQPGRVTIDGTTYPLAPGAILEDLGGYQLRISDRLRYRLPVQYWLGVGPNQGKITQMIVNLAAAS